MTHSYINHQIELTSDVSAEFSERIIPKGTQGVIVEVYKNPDYYAVDLAIPNDSLVGGFDYENVMLTPDQFIILAE